MGLCKFNSRIGGIIPFPAFGSFWDIMQIFHNAVCGYNIGSGRYEFVVELEFLSDMAIRMIGVEDHYNFLSGTYEILHLLDDLGIDRAAL